MKFRSAIALAVCLFVVRVLSSEAVAQERCTYHAPVSSGYGDIFDFSADAVCARIYARAYPIYVNGGDYIATGTGYLGTFYQGEFGGTHGWLCHFHRTTTRISDGAILHAETGPIMLEGATSRCHKPLRISLSGPDKTKALPAGPVLPQAAEVTENGAPAAGKSVSISIGSGGALSGATDGNGQFRFTYVPPYQRPLVDNLKASCAGCENTAQKQITVEACDLCVSNK